MAALPHDSVGNGLRIASPQRHRRSRTPLVSTRRGAPSWATAATLPIDELLIDRAERRAGRTDTRHTTAFAPPARYTTGMGGTRIVLEPDPVIEAYKKDIDRTLLRENLKLTPAERLRKLQSAVRGLVALRDAARKSRG